MPAKKIVDTNPDQEPSDEDDPQNNETDPTAPPGTTPVPPRAEGGGETGFGEESRFTPPEER